LGSRKWVWDFNTPQRSMHKCIHYRCSKLPAPSTETVLRVFGLDVLSHMDACVDTHFVVNKNVNKASTSFLYI